MTTVKLAYLFEAKYWHRGGRNPRTGFFVRESTLPILRTGRGDVEIGFQFRAASAGARKTEVLLFDDKLWWPMSLDENPEQVTLAQLQAKLLDHMFDLLGIGPQAPFRFVPDDPSINRMRTQMADEVLSRAHQKISENLMVCDGLVYAHGGEPVFIPAPPPGTSTAWSAQAPCFVNPGKDRAADVCRDGLRRQPGGCTSKAVQACFRNGAFVTIGEMRHAACDSSKILAAIEITKKLPDNIDATELQVDACFRELWKLKRTAGWACAAFALAKDPARDVVGLNLLDEGIVDWPISEAGWNGRETTLERVGSISDFVVFVDRNGLNFQRSDLVRECRQTIEKLERSGYRDRPNSRTLTSEDYRELGSLRENGVSPPDVNVSPEDSHCQRSG